jgi:hypothetical protein
LADKAGGRELLFTRDAEPAAMFVETGKTFCVPFFLPGAMETTSLITGTGIKLFAPLPGYLTFSQQCEKN